MYYASTSSGGLQFFSTEIDLAVTFTRAGEVRRAAIVNGPSD